MKKRTTKKPAARKSGKSKRNRAIQIIIGTFIFFAMCLVGYHYRNALSYYFSFRSKVSEEEKLHAIRNFQVLNDHKDMVFGFDVSEYQGKINWLQTDSIEGTFPLHFVFIRASAGNDKRDLSFGENWAAARKQGHIRGAYHYYRPDENSLEQAALFIKTVRLRKGDLPPVLDIEKIPEEQPVDSLKKGLRRWLDKVENHYNVKPIIYCGESYYSDFLEEEFGSEYEFWIANYNFFVEEIDSDWSFWQFTERGKIPGIIGNADINIFNGTRKDLRRLTIGN